MPKVIGVEDTSATLPSSVAAKSAVLMGSTPPRNPLAWVAALAALAMARTLLSSWSSPATETDDTSLRRFHHGLSLAFLFACGVTVLAAFLQMQPPPWAALWVAMLAAAPEALAPAVWRLKERAAEQAAAIGLVFERENASVQLGKVSMLVARESSLLREGAPHFVGYEVAASRPASDLMRIAGALAMGADDPISRCLVATARSGRLELPRVLERRREVDCIHGEVEGRQVLLGTLAAMRRNNIKLDGLAKIQRRIDDRLRRSESLTYLAQDGDCIGALATRDAIRPRAKADLRALRLVGARLTLLSRDDSKALADLAREFRTLEVVPDLGPQTGVDVIRSAREAGEFVASVALHDTEDPAHDVADMVLCHGHLRIETGTRPCAHVRGRGLAAYVRVLRHVRELGRAENHLRTITALYHLIVPALFAAAIVRGWTSPELGSVSAGVVAIAWTLLLRLFASSGTRLG